MNNQSFNSPEKNSIRKDWGKPLLKFLKKHLKRRLSYMGLPSPQARDIEEWLEYIDEVIAFQCRQYPEASNGDQNNDEVIELENKLREYRRQGKIESFNVFDGYLEEVLLKGRDSNNKTFQQSRTIKVYNLDFCNKITSPLVVIDNDGNYKKVYKFDAINKILERQKDSDGVKKFVLFLTIQANYDGQELNQFINNPYNKSHSSLISSASKLENKKELILRLFVINELERKCSHYGFTPHFLPTIKYSGLSNQRLLHFTLLACESDTPHQPPWYQSLDGLCSPDEAFIKVDTSCPKYSKPVDLFSQSCAYERSWR